MAVPGTVMPFHTVFERSSVLYYLMTVLFVANNPNVFFS